MNSHQQKLVKMVELRIQIHVTVSVLQSGLEIIVKSVQVGQRNSEL